MQKQEQEFIDYERSWGGITGSDREEQGALETKRKL